MDTLAESRANDEKLNKINVLQNRYATYGNIWTINEPIFSSKLILYFRSRGNIKQSFTLDNKNQNPVSELINKRTKALVTTKLIIKKTKALRNWRKTVPNKFKYLKIFNKSRNVEFSKLLFHSDFFEQKKL